MKVIETVDEHCKHKDCVFRGHLSHVKNSTACCDYLYLTGKRRGCKISECDKYRKGSRVIRIDRGIGFISSLEQNDEIADI